MSNWTPERRAALESERFNTDYRKFRPLRPVTAEQWNEQAAAEKKLHERTLGILERAEKKRLHDMRQDFFNAGRFAEGARDEEATKATKNLGKRIRKMNK
jgi:hypothetical protein